MNKYPRLILNFLSFVVIISSFLIILKNYGQINNSFYNLCDDDLNWRIRYIIIQLIFIMGTISVFYQKSLGWIFISSVFLEYLITLLKLLLTSESVVLLYGITLFAILISIIIFLYLPVVRMYLFVKDTYLCFPIIICIILLCFNHVKFDHKIGNINYFYLIDINGLHYYEDSIYTGKTIYFYDNGHKDFEGFIQNGRFNGEFKYYYRDGTISKIINYDNTQKDGPFNEWYEYPNDIKTEGQYNKGLKDGVWKMYGKDSEFIEIETYHLDTLISTEYVEEK